jgi:L-ascorbate metabolism protein UlaG (beta-lactamase superfamily)
MKPIIKGVIGVALIVTVLVGTFFALSGFLPIDNPPDDEWNGPTDPEDPDDPDEQETLEPPEGLSYNGVDIVWLVVGGVKLKYDDIVIYIDPFDINGRNESVLETADYVIITHNHLPHCSPSDIQYVSNSNTTLIVARGAAWVSGINEDEIVLPGDVLTYGNISLEFVRAYNIDKYNSEGSLFHPPSHDNLGVVMDFNGTRVYHAGDTDVIPEMKNISADIALLPVSGYAWMEAEEAAIAVDYIQESANLTYAIPIHWGYNEGSRFDAIRFQDLANCTVIILDLLFYKYE